jgi:hypothetical protein
MKLSLFPYSTMVLTDGHKKLPSLQVAGRSKRKTLEKTKWTDTGSAAKKYEGWVEEGTEFFNNQVEELQSLRRMATSKTIMEEKYLQKRREKMEEKMRGPVNQSF